MFGGVFLNAGCFLSLTVTVMELTNSKSNGLIFSSSWIGAMDCLLISSWIKLFTMQAALCSTDDLPICFVVDVWYWTKVSSDQVHVAVQIVQCRRITV